ncbi:Zn(2)-C6 fungal-type domain-containing protein [Mycena kentingensis (nom. inval.)]|nr:Zn(2)-C6 fungal-type domain-containing protein [Mycena kentingensis (nom. inval.)]
MSSDEGQAPKRKKVSRPCDSCRKRKRRCDGEEPCSRCVKYEFVCSYEQKAAKRPSSSYVQSIESRLKTVEALLNQQLPAATEASSPGSGTQSSAGPGVQVVIAALRSITNPPPPSDISFEVANKLDSLKISGFKFQGKSSGAVLVQRAIDVGCSGPLVGIQKMPHTGKPWTLRPWLETTRPTRYTFPDDDLLPSLVSLYFTHVNAFYPLMHRPSFDFISTKSYETDTEFGAIVLLVCALGAQYSTDPRIRSDPAAPAGHVWFDQVDLGAYHQPTVRTIQIYALGVHYLERNAGQRSSWMLAGAGIRLGQDIGAHHEKMRAGTFVPYLELEKRAYWMLMLLDTQLSAALGRSVAIPNQDFGLAMPVGCDDEYWTSDFVQPADVPSRMDFFILQLKLQRIIAYTLKILYASDHSQKLIGLDDDNWENQLIVEFDSALNSWFELIPAHLKWNAKTDSTLDPSRNALFFDQSAALYCMYYFTQILIHRPFIPAAHQVKGPGARPRTFPSLSICNNAARACARLIEVYHKHYPNKTLICGATPFFTAGTVLLLNVWGMARNNLQTTGSVAGVSPRRKAGAPAQSALDMTDVYRCANALAVYRKAWPGTAHLADTLDALLKIDLEQAVNAQFAYPPKQPPRQPGTQADDYTSSVFAGPPLDSAALDAAVAEWAGAEGNHSIPPSTVSAQSELDFGFTQQQGLDGLGLDSSAYTMGVENMPFTTPSTDPFAMDVDIDTVSFWSSAPTGFGGSDWDGYLRALNVNFDASGGGI